jgi:N-acetylneuraminic acid mutarotase
MTTGLITPRTAAALLQTACALAALSGCGGGNGGGPAPTTTMPTYSLGGTIAGLSGPGLVLADGGATVALAANATTFTFPSSLKSGAAYAVTIQAQPAGQTCIITNGEGTIGTSKVTNIAIACPSPWTWIGGPSSPAGTAVYGTLGVAAPGNLPGARSDGVTWTDAAGNFWLFGGTDSSADAYFNDLWQYSAITGEWKWVGGANTPNSLGVYGTQGVAAPGNTPGARAAASFWTDAAGNLWLFGGVGFASAAIQAGLNDLWEYSPSTGLWKWVSGSNVSGSQGVYGTQGVASSANVPPARDKATSWIDASGNLWLFGGIDDVSQQYGPPSALQDLWEYDPSSGLWTWVSGPMGRGNYGVYGTRGVAAPANLPGARSGGAGWIDKSGNLWLFGGASNFTPELAYYGDLWRFDPSNGLWTWMAGSNAIDDTGQYGTEGTPAEGNYPPPRSDVSKVIDPSGKFWLFGGFGVNSGYGAIDLAPGQFNDLWRFDPASGQWTWVSGTNGPAGAGTYGTQGMAAPGNVPTARGAAFLWMDSAGNLFLFGGYDFAGGGSAWNDLWEFAGANFP